MSKQAAEHHGKAAEHHEHAARHHREAAKHHESGNYETAAHHAHSAQGHLHHATHHAAEAAKSHVEHHGSSPKPPVTRPPSRAGDRRNGAVGKKTTCRLSPHPILNAGQQDPDSGSNSSRSISPQ